MLGAAEAPRCMFNSKTLKKQREQKTGEWCQEDANGRFEAAESELLSKHTRAFR